jgi:hypothetical protein
MSIWEHSVAIRPPYDGRMQTIPLAVFITEHRDELIGLCRAKVAERSSPPPTHAEIDHGVPMFLSQLSKQLSRRVPHTDEISVSAREHGHDLLMRGFTIDQVVRDYGDVCQSVTALAVDSDTAISAEDFRTLNKCLDDAIAGAVTAFAQEQDGARNDELSELRRLVNAASVAFEALQSGRVGVGGATGSVVGRSLASLRGYVDRREMEASGAPAPVHPKPFIIEPST